MLGKNAEIIKTQLSNGVSQRMMPELN